MFLAGAAINGFVHVGEHAADVGIFKQTKKQKLYTIFHSAMVFFSAEDYGRVSMCERWGMGVGLGRDGSGRDLRLLEGGGGGEDRCFLWRGRGKGEGVN